MGCTSSSVWTGHVRRVTSNRDDRSEQKDTFLINRDVRLGKAPSWRQHSYRFQRRRSGAFIIENGPGGPREYLVRPQRKNSHRFREPVSTVNGLKVVITQSPTRNKVAPTTLYEVVVARMGYHKRAAACLRNRKFESCPNRSSYLWNKLRWATLCLQNRRTVSCLRRSASCLKKWESASRLQIRRPPSCLRRSVSCVQSRRSGSSLLWYSKSLPNRKASPKSQSDTDILSSLRRSNAVCSSRESSESARLPEAGR